MNILVLLIFISTISLAMDAPPAANTQLSKKRAQRSLFTNQTEINDPVAPLNNIVNAIKRGDVLAVKAFIALGIDINQRYSESEFSYPIHNRSQVTTITEPNDHRTDNTALMYAALYGKESISQLLLEAGAHPNLQNRQRHTALTLCKSSTPIMRLLLTKNADPNIPTFQGFTALMYAFMCRNYTHAELLLQHGADTLQTNDNGFSAADYARQAGQNFVDLLIIYENLKNLKRMKSATAPLQASPALQLTAHIYTAALETKPRALGENPDEPIASQRTTKTSGSLPKEKQDDYSCSIS